MMAILTAGCIDILKEKLARGVLSYNSLLSEETISMIE